MKTLILAVVLCAFGVTAQAAPALNVGAIYDYLDPGKTSYTKRIYNGGDSTAYVKVSVLEIHYKPDGSFTETPVKGLDAAGKGTGLIASPARLIIPVKGMQTTRLLFRGDRSEERYYRVRFVPVLPTKADEFSVDEADREKYNASMSAGINVMAGYGTVFFVRPANARFDSQINNSASRYTLNNQGNSTVLVDNFKDCPAQGGGECEPVKKHHVLPNKTFALDKIAGREYSFDLIEGTGKKSIVVE